MGFGIDDSIGKLVIRINSNVTTSLTAEVRAVVNDDDVPLKIRYTSNLAQFQSACNVNEGHCSTVVGGGFITDDDSGLDCTIAIAVEREWTDFWGTTKNESGIVVPNHCNIGTYMMQHTWNDNAHRFGQQSDDGGWYCDCDFINSTEGRTISKTTINNNGTDITISSKGDASVDDVVWMYGIKTGAKKGVVVAVDQTETFDGNSFSNLYKIKDVTYTDGDSGAPVLNSGKTKFTGMNIGSMVDDNDTTDDTSDDVNYQYAHEWSFLKDKLELKD